MSGNVNKKNQDTSRLLILLFPSYTQFYCKQLLLAILIADVNKEIADLPRSVVEKEKINYCTNRNRTF